MKEKGKQKKQVFCDKSKIFYEKIDFIKIDYFTNEQSVKLKMKI